MAKITSSSTAEYFAKNLQQVGFSSPVKAVLTTLKESVDNSLDACEQNGILPELSIKIERVGKGASKNNDLIEIEVEDNGPGIEPDLLPKVFGEYLASSKFGRGQCTRGQQGIGISAAVTWAQLTNAKGVWVTSKTENMRKAVQALIDVDIKQNKGLIRKKETIDWDKKKHGVKVTFAIDGRVQLNGEGGLLTYLDGTTLVNPHLQMKYKLLENDWVDIPRVSDVTPDIPQATLPHPHTMKLGEFITHARLYGNIPLKSFLRKAFSRITDQTIKDFKKAGLKDKVLGMSLTKISEEEFKKAFQIIQETEIQNPSTKSVLTIGEESMAKSIHRLGEVDFFSVVTRKPKICDFKPVVVEVAIARFKSRGSEEEQVQLLRFANRVPLQFDKSACAITKAVETVNWKPYGLNQPKDSIPYGPYVFAISVVSPFIKFKNASKETIDSSDELVEEIRLALIQAGQRLSRHIKKEMREADLERKIAHIEKFGPILIEGLARMVGAGKDRKDRAEKGLEKILGRDTRDAKSELAEAEDKLKAYKEKHTHIFSMKKVEVTSAEEGTDGNVASGEGETPSPNGGDSAQVVMTTKKTAPRTTKKKK
ncbi:MAG: DNA topoisomerase VI subunit B [Proteobacteria bacterium SG_bin7]|nr:MAG: DNA topoisomerase VI subunit B [Proteobacteria bacterium SG_bin7]